MATRKPKGLNKADWELLQRVRRSVERWHVRLGLPPWQINIEAATGPLEDSVLGGPCSATIYVEARTNLVTLRYDPKHIRQQGVDKVIRHELLHWLFLYLDMTLANLLSDEEFALARSLEESIIEAVAQSYGRK